MNIFDAMTAPEQEIFDFVLAKIREQGRPSYSPEGELRGQYHRARHEERRASH